MTDALASAWRHHPAGTPTQVGVTLLDLVPHASATLPLFPDEDERLRLSHALDRVNKRFGSSALYPATVHHVRAAAPTRIGFTRIPTPSDFATNG
jgi:DNA polymerase-4